VTTTTEFVREGELSVLVLLPLLALIVSPFCIQIGKYDIPTGIVAAVILMERGHRRIPVQYAKRVVGRRVYGGQSSHLPLKLNTAGVIPPIFASSVLLFPGTIASFADHPWAQWVAGELSPGSVWYNLFYVALIIFFCYFYTAVVFNPVDVADNMKKYGGFIPGIRPGQRTAEYIDRVLSRVTLSGAIYISLICVLPNLLINSFNVPFYFGGTALLIVVGVALDTVAQIETQILMRNYEGFMKRGRLRGRRG
jgi:preprotein translocase subunit SecY